VINDYADRHVDGAVERTKNRPLVTGAITPWRALLLFAVLSLSAGLLVLLLNRDCQLLALGGLAVAALYPFMKRWTYLPQTVLGAAFSWGILMAWAATKQGLNSTAGLMFVGSVLWIVAYDTMYAMVDRPDDLKAGIKSTAILFGEQDRLMIGILQLSALLAFFLLGQKLAYAYAYYVALACCAGLFVYQQYLIRDREASACMAAFANNIQVGFVLFCGTVVELSIRSLGD
jgi:4-hydroxybenzoate polyprenyltransferase